MAIWMGFLALVPIVVFAPFVRQFVAAPYSTASRNAIGVLFNLTPRIAAASVVAYLAANFTDVFLFKKIRDRLPERKWLWLRKNGSTFVSQGVDQLVFVSLTFAFVVPWEVYGNMLLSATSSRSSWRHLKHHLSTQQNGSDCQRIFRQIRQGNESLLNWGPSPYLRGSRGSWTAASASAEWIGTKKAGAHEPRPRLFCGGAIRQRLTRSLRRTPQGSRRSPGSWRRHRH
jgi:hypothetical protein